MKLVALLVLALCVEGGLAAVHPKRISVLAEKANVKAGGDHPIQKIITMLEDIATKAEEEGKEEALAFDKFEHWYKNSAKTLSKAIADETENIESLESRIASLEAKIKSLTGQIADLEAQITKLDEANRKAKQIRDDENKNYQDNEKDLRDTIKALEDGIDAMEKSKAGASSLLAIPSAVLVQPQVTKALDILDAYEGDFSAAPSFLQFAQDSSDQTGVTGEDACENQEYDQTACEAIGCCHYSQDTCLSSVGKDQCGEASDRKAKEQALLRVGQMYSRNARMQAIQKRQQESADEMEHLLARQEAKEEEISAAAGKRSEAAPAPAPLKKKDRPKFLSKGDYEKHVKKYSFKSGNVIELLKKLVIKFDEELTATNKAETNAQNAYDLAKAARKDATDAATDSKKEKETAKSDAEQALVDAEKDLKSEKDDLEADTATLKETETSYSVKKQEWQERSKVREQEIEAIAIAKKILAKVTKVQTGAPKNPVPPPSPVKTEPTFFLQLSQSSPDKRTKALNLLLHAASATHSKSLEQLAKQLSVMSEGPLDEAINMIEKMIFRLMDEQKDEDEHKLWCDEELEKTNTSKVNKEDKISDFTTDIDAATAKIGKLTKDIEEANGMIREIEAFDAEAAEIRAIGKKENAVALKEAKEAQAACAEASAVLTAFYKDSGAIEKESWEFVQEPVKLPDNPATWDSNYVGVSDKNTQPAGILAILEKTSSEFATMEADTKAQEAEDQAAFDKQMSETAIEKARRSKEVEMKDADKKKTVAEEAALKKKRGNVQKELDAVNQYLEDLQPPCVEGGATYETRKAARKKEIEALRQAQGILQNPESAAPAAAQPTMLETAQAPAAASMARVRRTQFA